MQRAGGSCGHCHAGGGLFGHARDEHGHEDGNTERSSHITEHVVRAGSGGGLSRSNTGQGDLHEDGAVAADAETDKEQCAAHHEDAGILADEEHDQRADGDKHERDGSHDLRLLLVGHGAEDDGADRHAEVLNAHGNRSDGGLVDGITEADDLGQAGGHKALGQEHDQHGEHEVLTSHELAVEDRVGGLLLNQEEDDEADDGHADGRKRRGAGPAVLLAEGGHADERTEHEQDEHGACPVKALHGAFGDVRVILDLCKADQERDHAQRDADPHDDAPCIGRSDDLHDDAADGGSKDDHAAGNCHVDREALAHLLGRELHHDVGHDDRGDAGCADTDHEAEHEQQRDVLRADGDERLADRVKAHGTQQHLSAADHAAELAQDRRHGGGSQGVSQRDEGQGRVGIPGRGDRGRHRSGEAAAKAQDRRRNSVGHKAFHIVFVVFHEYILLSSDSGTKPCDSWFLLRAQ